MTQDEIDAFFERYKLVEIFNDSDKDNYAMFEDSQHPVEYDPRSNPDWTDEVPEHVIVAYMDAAGVYHAVRRRKKNFMNYMLWDNFSQEEADLFGLIAFPFLKEQNGE